MAVASAWYVVSALANRGLNFLAIAITARYLGREQFGRLGIVLSTIGVVVGYASLGLGPATSKYVAEFRDSSPERASGILALSAGIATLAGAVAAAVLFSLRHQIAAKLFADPGLAGGITIGCAILLFGVVSHAQTGAMAGLEAFRPMARTSVVTAAISLPLVVLATRFAGLQGALWGLLASGALNCACFHFVIWKLSRERNLPRPTVASVLAERKLMVQFNLPALLTSAIIGSVNWFCGVLIVRTGGGFSQFGLYTAADKWRQLLLFPTTCITSAALPTMANACGRRDSPAFKRAVRDMLALATLGTVPPSALLAAGSKIGMAAFGIEFRNGACVLALASLATIPTMFNTILGLPMIAAGRMWTRLAYDTALAVLLVIGTLLLVPRLEAFGAMLAQLLAYAIISAALSMSIKRSMPAPAAEPRDGAVVSRVSLES
jgi:O-antigen/teichoic acid export membrane protein